MKFKTFEELSKFIWNKLKTEHITEEYLDIIKKYDCDKHTRKQAEEELNELTAICSSDGI